MTPCEKELWGDVSEVLIMVAVEKSLVTTLRMHKTRVIHAI